jgi:hypothetical protein
MNLVQILRRAVVSALAHGSAILCLAAVLIGTSACATYPQRTEAAFRDFQSGQLEKAEKAFADPDTTGSEFLQYAESGMCAMAAGDWDTALDQLSKAAALSKAFEDEALINPASAGEALLSWTINESMTSYKGEGYERVMIHACLAMVYLAKGDATGAEVEVRRADGLLESEEKLYEKSYHAGGLGHVLSAIAYELDRKPADAYIDYERMIDKGVGEPLAGRALVRLSGVLHRKDDLARWEDKFGADEERPPDAASVVVVAGVGIGPFKREITIPIPTPDGLLQWSVPDYESRPQPVADLVLDVAGGDRSVRTVVVEDVAAVATENLKDRIVWLAAKSAVRAFLKLELTKELDKQMGGLGTLVGIVFTAVTERADLRSWSTLPSTWQAARMFLPPGRHHLDLTAEGGERVSLGTYDLDPGETMFVFARTIGPRLFAHPVGGKRVEDEPAAPAAVAPAESKP